MLNNSDYSDGDNIIINLNEYMYQETGWKFGHIDEEVLYSNYTKGSTYLMDKAGNYILTKSAELIEIKQHFEPRMRWLEDIDTDWFTFISENISEEFECVPVFDNTKQKIDSKDSIYIKAIKSLYIARESYGLYLMQKHHKLLDTKKNKIFNSSAEPIYYFTQ